MTEKDMIERGLLGAVANGIKRDELARAVCEAAKIFVANAGKPEHAHGRTSFTGPEYQTLLAALACWNDRP